MCLVVENGENLILYKDRNRFSLLGTHLFSLLGTHLCPPFEREELVSDG